MTHSGIPSTSVPATESPTSGSQPPVDRSGLREAVRGRVVLPGDDAFDALRLPWNRAVEQPVRAVVEAADADDVASLVRYASEIGVSIATQPNGHGASGRTEDTILLRTGLLDGIRIDARSRRATIGAGVRSGQLQQAAAAYGLTALPGSSPVVSVAGVALGGGLSWFGRAHGWVADSVVSFEVVGADAQKRTVTAATDPDLFWALRGGGGDYAIVTALELQLHEAPAVFGGRMLWSGEHTAAVVDAFRAVTGSAPSELTMWLELLHFPGGEPLVAIDLTYLGEQDAAGSHLAALDGLPAPLSDTRRMMTVAELGTITAEPTDPGAGLSRGELLAHLDGAAIDALLDSGIAPLMSVQIRHLGGAFEQASDTPHGPLLAPFAIYLFGAPGVTGSAADILSKQSALASALPTTGRKPVTFLNPTEQLSNALPAEAIERLRAIKAERDPAGLFRSNFPA